MLYEFKVKKLKYSPENPECIFCKKPVNMGDYFLICKKHGNKYFSIKKIFRILLPKFIIKRIIIKEGERTKERENHPNLNEDLADDYKPDNTLLELRVRKFIGVEFTINYDDIWNQFYIWINIPFVELCLTLGRRKYLTKIAKFTNLW
jgi:hypothetical protein